MRSDGATPTRLGDPQRLGWSTWLGGSDAASARTTAHAGANAQADGGSPGYAIGMVFEPERYLGGAQAAAA